MTARFTAIRTREQSPPTPGGRGGDTTIHGEDGLAIDLDEVAHIVERSELLVVGFPVCAQRLLLDLRLDPSSPPLVEVVEPVRGAAERARWLAARRPRLGAPERSVFFVWPHSVAYLDGSGVLKRLATRLRDEHGHGAVDHLRLALDELRSLERDFRARAIRGGEGFETVWVASRRA